MSLAVAQLQGVSRFPSHPQRSLAGGAVLNEDPV